MVCTILWVWNDFIAAKAKYHQCCHSFYENKSNLQHIAFIDCTKSKESLYSDAFNKRVDNIGTDMEAGKACNISTPLAKFKVLVSSNNLDQQSYTTPMLKLPVSKSL